MSDRDWLGVKTQSTVCIIRGNQCKIWGSVIGVVGLLAAIGGSSAGGFLVLVGAGLYVYGLYLRSLVR